MWQQLSQSLSYLCCVTGHPNLSTWSSRLTVCVVRRVGRVQVATCFVWSQRLKSWHWPGVCGHPKAPLGMERLPHSLGGCWQQSDPSWLAGLGPSHADLLAGVCSLLWSSAPRQLASLRRAGWDKAEEAVEKEIRVFYNLITEGVRNHTVCTLRVLTYISSKMESKFLFCLGNTFTFD